MDFNSLIKKASVFTTPSGTITVTTSGTASSPSYSYSTVNLEGINSYEPVFNPDGSVGLVPSNSLTVQVAETSGTSPTYSYSTDAFTVNRSLNLGWNAGAESYDQFFDNTLYEFQVSNTQSGVVIGLTHTAYVEGYGYTRIEFALTFTSGQYAVMENGVQVTPYRPVNDGDGVNNFGVMLSNGQVIYLVDREVFYISDKYVTTFPMQVDVSLYAAGDAVYNSTLTKIDRLPTCVSKSTTSARIANHFDLEITSASSTSAEAISTDTNLIQSSSKTTAIATGDHNVSLAASTSSSQTATYSAFGGFSYSISNASMAQMASIGGKAVQSSSSTQFEPMESEALADLFTPSISIVYSVNAAMVGAGIGLTGGVSVSSDMEIAPLDAMASDKVYGESVASMSGMTSYGYEEIDYDGLIGWMPTECTLSAFGYPSELIRLRGTAPFVSLAAQGGGSAKLTTPKLSLSVTGTLESIGRLSASTPVPTVSASGLTGAIGTLNEDTPFVRLTAFSGSGLRGRAPMATLFASATTTTIGRMSAEIPQLTLEATGTIFVLSTANVLIPVPVMSYAVLAAEAPMPTLYAGQNLTTSQTSHVYVINRKLGEVTEYTNYDVDYAGTLNGVKLAIHDSGINEITGMTDNGDLIDSRVSFQLSDFGVSEQKRVLGLYLAGDGDGDLYVSARTHDEEASANESDNKYHIGPDTRRVKLGKGMRGRYVGVTVESVAGEPFSLANVEYLIGVMERRR